MLLSLLRSGWWGVPDANPSCPGWHNTVCTVWQEDTIVFALDTHPFTLSCLKTRIVLSHQRFPAWRFHHKHSGFPSSGCHSNTIFITAGRGSFHVCSPCPYAIRVGWIPPAGHWCKMCSQLHWCNSRGILPNSLESPQIYSKCKWQQDFWQFPLFASGAMVVLNLSSVLPMPQCTQRQR